MSRSHRILLAFTTALAVLLSLVPAHPAAAADVIYRVIAGEVTLGDAATPAGAGEVRVQATQYQNSGNIFTTLTDAAGHYEVTVPANTNFNGKFYVSFTYLGSGPFASMTWPDRVAGAQGYLVDIESADRRDISMTLPGPHQLSGRVQLGVNGLSAPAGQVAVHYVRYTGSGWSESPAVLTDASGRYTFPSVLPGYVRIFAEYLGDDGVYQDRAWTGLPGQLGEGTFELRTTDANDLDIVLPHTATLSGLVSVGSSGRPASAGEIQVKVTVYQFSSAVQTVIVSTGPNGRYSVPGLFTNSGCVVEFTDAEGDEWLRAESSCWSDGSSDDIVSDVVLAPNPAASGISGVVRAGGVPAAGILVSANRFDASSGGFVDTLTATTDAAGRYTITAPGGGVLAVYFEDPAGVRASATWDQTSFYGVPDLIEVESGARVSGIDINLPLAASLVGRVSGRGLGATEFDAGYVGVEVEMFDYGVGDWVATGWSWGVDSTGAFDIYDLFPGTYRFVAWYDGPRGSVETVSPMFVQTAGAVHTWNPVLSLASAHPPVIGAIAAAWESTGAENGPAGFPTFGQMATFGFGVMQQFENGRYYWSAATGAHFLPSASFTAYGANGWLGFPIAEQACATSTRCYQVFQGGTLYTSPSGTWPVYGAILDGWLRLGKEWGVTGSPASREYAWGGGAYQEFENGRLYWSPGSGTHFVPTGSVSGFVANAWLGFPLTEQICAQPNKCYQLFQRGTMYTSTGGTWPVYGGILEGWLRLGKEWGVSGFPVSREYAWNGGVYQEFQNGRLYWSPFTGTRFVPTASVAAFASNAWLGFPLTDGACGLPRNGCYQVFQRGILYSSDAGRYPVYGAILDHWTQLRREWGVAGYPVGPETATSEGAFQQFENGRIVWSPMTGARYEPTVSR